LHSKERLFSITSFDFLTTLKCHYLIVIYVYVKIIFGNRE